MNKRTLRIFKEIQLLRLKSNSRLGRGRIRSDILKVRKGKNKYSYIGDLTDRQLDYYIRKAQECI